MSGLPWGKWVWKDWLTDPALSVCSLAAQGLWMRMLCVMAQSDPVGHLVLPRRSRSESDSVRVSRMLGVDARSIAPLIRELEQAGVFTRIEGVIINRRMVREHQKSEAGREFIARRWGKTPNRSPEAQPNRSPNRSNGSDLLPDSDSDSDKDSPSPTPTPASGGGASPSHSELVKAVEEAARRPPFRVLPGGAR